VTPRALVLCVAVEKGLPGRVDSEPDSESEAQAVLRLRLVRSVLRRGTRGHEPFRLYLELAPDQKAVSPCLL